MDKSEIKLYRPEEVKDKISEFEKDWTKMDDFASMHKTGLKMVRLESEDGKIADVAENQSDWMRHMSLDEHLTGREVYMYYTRLKQEFAVLADRYFEQLKEFSQKIELLNAMGPYIATTTNKKYKS